MRRSAGRRHGDHRASGQPVLVCVGDRVQQARGVGGAVQQVHGFHQAVVVLFDIRTTLRALRRVITSGARPLHTSHAGGEVAAQLAVGNVGHPILLAAIIARFESQKRKKNNAVPFLDVARRNRGMIPRDNLPRIP
jgi:hypothetical protein